MPWSSRRQLASIERSGQNALDSKSRCSKTRYQSYVQADKVDNISVLNMLKPQKQAIRTDYLRPTILKGEECVMYVHALKSKNW